MTFYPSVFPALSREPAVSLAQLGIVSSELQVSIKALKAVHIATHPARPIRSRLARGDASSAAHASDEAEALLALLDAEGESEDA